MILENQNVKKTDFTVNGLKLSSVPVFLTQDIFIRFSQKLD